jgi:hypothetical protein
MIWACKALAKEVLKSSFYALPFFALVGLWVLRNRFREDPSATLLGVVVLSQIALLLVVGAGAGYIAGRHTLLIAMCCCFFAAASFPALGAWFARQRPKTAAAWSAGLAVVFVGISSVGGMKHLHANREGHHQAGVWLASQLGPNDYLVDPFAWSEYYAGYIRVEPKDHPDVKREFSVIENPNGNPHPRLNLMEAALDIAHRGRIVYHWPENAPIDKAQVYVYRFDRKDWPKVHAN